MLTNYLSYFLEEVNYPVHRIHQHSKHFILFTLILSILFMLIQVPFYKGQEYGYQYKNVMTKLKYLSMEKENSIDVMFLGDSEGKAAFDSLSLFHENGISSYNLCTNFQWAIDTVALTKHMYASQKPKLVVMEASFIFTTLRKRRILLAKYLPIFNYHELYKQYLIHPEKPDILKGFSPTDKAVPFTGSLEYMTEDTSYYPIDAWTLDYLQQVKETLEKQGTKLLLVSAPNPLYWNTAKHNAIQAWCDQNQVTYVDYNLKLDELNINWQEDSRDGGDHLNSKGAAKFINALGQYLQENYNLTDHRNDNDYADWEEDYKKLYGGTK